MHTCTHRDAPRDHKLLGAGPGCELALTLLPSAVGLLMQLPLFSSSLYVFRNPEGAARGWEYHGAPRLHRWKPWPYQTKEAPKSCKSLKKPPGAPQRAAYEPQKVRAPPSAPSDLCMPGGTRDAVLSDLPQLGLSLVERQRQR